MTDNDTIAAVATPPGTGALAVVRVSGEKTAEIITQVFAPKGCGFPLPSHLMCYGAVKDKNETVDEVMCTFMYSPRSYTREDMAEIYCHGGTGTVLDVLRVLYKNGARPAEPGEFTKRAFLNGRIDLSQAEAVMELINTRTDFARRAVLRKLHGGLSRKIKAARDNILTWLAHIELSVDYPEHEEEAMNLDRVSREGGVLLDNLNKLLATAKTGERIKSGIPTVIVGKPNVGKSSLMNAVLQEERAIVTETAGTTRDVLTETVTIHGGSTQFNGVPLILTDTAGIRDSTDAAEKIGVERSKEQARSAELALHVIDRSKPLTDEDYAVADIIQIPHKIIVLNKCDLPAAQEINDLKMSGEVTEVSAKTGEGLDKLYAKIEKMFFDGDLSAEGDIITHARHAYLLGNAIDHLRAAVDDIANGMTEDIISINLKSAYILLGEMIGEEVGDDVLDRIFSEFCVGK